MNIHNYNLTHQISDVNVVPVTSVYTVSHKNVLLCFRQ